MSDRYARYGAATGILFVLFVIIGFLVTPNSSGRRCIRGGGI